MTTSDFNRNLSIYFACVFFALLTFNLGQIGKEKPVEQQLPSRQSGRCFSNQRTLNLASITLEERLLFQANCQSDLQRSILAKINFESTNRTGVAWTYLMYYSPSERPYS